MATANVKLHRSAVSLSFVRFQLRQEWTVVAMVIDRIFLIIYIVGLITGTIAILMDAPLAAEFFVNYILSPNSANKTYWVKWPTFSPPWSMLIKDSCICITSKNVVHHRRHPAVREGWRCISSRGLRVKVDIENIFSTGDRTWGFRRGKTISVPLDPERQTDFFFVGYGIK